MTNIIRSIFVIVAFIVVSSNFAFANAKEIKATTLNEIEVSGILICESEGSQIKNEIEDFIRNSSVDTNKTNIMADEIRVIATVSRCEIYNENLKFHNPNPFSGADESETDFDDFDDSDQLDNTSDNTEVMLDDVEVNKPPHSIHFDDTSDF